jgi:peptidoglycan/LPS O-acetylase OafA/YrhL
MAAANSDVATSLPEAAMRGGHAASGAWVEHRSAGIDILRGLCALLVVLHHIHLRFRINHFDVASLLPRPLSEVVFRSGHFSVITFFVISGFLITMLSLRRWSSLERIDWLQFYRLRFARIGPCLLLLVALLSVLHLSQAEGFVINPERSTLGRAVLAALTFHVNWLEGRHGYLPGTWDILWSLSVEEVFYLAFPVICLLCRNPRWLLVPLLSLIVIGPPYRTSLIGQEPWDEYAYLSCMDGISFGCLAALFTSRWRLKLNALRSMMALGLSAVLLIVVFRVANPALYQVGLDISVLELGVALILIALSQGVGSTVLTKGTRFIRMVGRSSYELYLTHMLVVLSPMPFIVQWQPDARIIPVLYVAMLILSIALGWLVHRLYSEPLNKALRYRRDELRGAAVPTNTG